MSLAVHNFCTKEKLVANRYHNLLLQNAIFYIIVSKGEEFRELAVNISKKFHYERHVSYGDFETVKVNEYNVLVDFILNNKKELIEKWHLEEGEIEELLEGLKLCLIRDYSTCSGIKRYFLMLCVLLGALLQKFYRSIKKC